MCLHLGPGSNAPALGCLYLTTTMPVGLTVALKVSAGRKVPRGRPVSSSVAWYPPGCVSPGGTMAEE